MACGWPRPAAATAPLLPLLSVCTGPPLTQAAVATLVDVLWRPLLAGLSCVLSRVASSSSHEPLLLVLLRGYQVRAVGPSIAAGQGFKAAHDACAL